MNSKEDKNTKKIEIDSIEYYQKLIEFCIKKIARHEEFRKNCQTKNMDYGYHAGNINACQHILELLGG